jgi:RNA polymerase sigma-70 factor (ECF subfamily)
MSDGGGRRFGLFHPSPGAELDEIEAVYRESAVKLRRIAAAIIGDREAALDAVQLGFSTAVRRRASFRGDGPIEAWVWRIVVNEARDMRARLLARSGAEIATEAPEPGFTSHLEGPGEEILRALSELSERQRLVVFLRYYADLDYPAIASVLAISEGRVGATLNQAHARLRELLEEVSP